MRQNFLQLYGKQTLEKLTEDWEEVKVDHESDPWLNFPPKQFLEFVARYPETPFDSIPSSENHIKAPSYLVSQAHRIWQTSSMVNKQLVSIGAKQFVDLGSFPFFVPLLLRDYFGFTGEILVSTNLDLSANAHEFLNDKNISVCKLDLDPYVSDPKNSADSRLATSLPILAGSADLILLSHVVEHLYHPRSIIKECSRALRNGGQIIVTTDNAMMIDVFGNFVGGYGYTFEPIENTAAMAFNFWRGHVRFFTERDLTTLLEGDGLIVKEVDFSHCFYDILFKDFFKTPDAILPGWKRAMLAETPWLRNDIAVIAQKS